MARICQQVHLVGQMRVEAMEPVTQVPSVRLQLEPQEEFAQCSQTTPPVWRLEWRATISATIQMFNLISKAKLAALIGTQEIQTLAAGQITPMTPQETGTACQQNLPPGMHVVGQLLQITPECAIDLELTSWNVLMAHVPSPVPQPLLALSQHLHLALERGQSAMTPTQQTMLQE